MNKKNNKFPDRLRESKRAFKREQAKLSFEEKIDQLKKLQKIAAELKKAKGEEPNFVWGEELIS